MSIPQGPVRVLRVLCWMWPAEQEHDDIRTPHRKFGYIISSCPKVKEAAQLKPYGHEFPIGFCVPCWESWLEFTPLGKRQFFPDQLKWGNVSSSNWWFYLFLSTLVLLNPLVFYIYISLSLSQLRPWVGLLIPPFLWPEGAQEQQCNLS